MKPHSKRGFILSQNDDENTDDGIGRATTVESIRCLFGLSSFNTDDGIGRTTTCAPEPLGLLAPDE